jgi:hypothetical protein
MGVVHGEGKGVGQWKERKADAGDNSMREICINKTWK